LREFFSPNGWLQKKDISIISFCIGKTAVFLTGTLQKLSWLVSRGRSKTELMLRRHPAASATGTFRNGWRRPVWREPGRGSALAAMDDTNNSRGSDFPGSDPLQGLASVRGKGPAVYPPISRLAVVGDRRTAAMIAADGSMQWLCLPNFDGVPIFGQLLDAGRGGYWCLGPASEGIRAWPRAGCSKPSGRRQMKR
jgi:Domain of unknown function (DUF5911)